MEIAENPWNYHTNVLLELSNHWNLLESTGANILRVMVQNSKRSKISDIEHTVYTVEFGVKSDKNNVQ